MLTFGWWIRSVSPRILQNARPVQLKRGVLWVNTSSASWAQHLDVLKPDLLRAIQFRGGQQDIKDLRFRVGPLPPLPASLQQKESQATTTLTPEDISILPEGLAQRLATLPSEDLRETIARAALAQIRESKR